MKRWLSSFVLSCCAAVVSLHAQAAVDPTTGEYRTEVSDLSVKVVGGSLSWTREYEANAWRFAPTWSALRLEIDALDDTVARIDRAGDLYEKIDSAGTLYRFDERLTIRKTESGWRWADRDGNWVEYTATGRPTRLGNRVGNTVTLNYQGEQLASVVDPMNRTVFTVTWANGQIASVKDHTNREVKYGYTGNLLTQVTDVRGKPWKYEYTDGKLSKLVDPLNHATTITLSAAGRARVVTDPVGAVTRYAFDYLSGPKQYYLKTIRENGELQEVTETWTDRERELVRRDVNGVTLLTVARDGRNRIHIDYRGRRTTYQYDEFRNPTGVIYPDGSKVTSTYDAGTSNLLTTTNEIGTVTQHQYYANGLRRRTIEAKGTDAERITEYVYDPQGRLTTITQVADAVTQEAVTRYTYDDAGNVTTITDAEGGIVKLEDYDALGNARAQFDALGKKWANSFDSAGNVLSESDPLEHTVRHLYDDAGRKTDTTFPPAAAGASAAKVSFSYNASDRLQTTTNALGGSKRTNYDALGRATEFADESEKKVKYSYDAFGRIRSVIDGNGNATRILYPDSVPAANAVGGFFQPVRIEHPTFTRELAYDLRGRQTSKADTYVTLEGSRREETLYRFDALGNLIEGVTAAGRITKRSFDPLRRVVSSVDAMQGLSRHSYDDRDNVLAFVDPNQQAHLFSYDRLNRMRSETRPLGQSYTFDYDANGSLIRRVDPEGQVAVHTYDDAQRRITTSSFKDNQSVPQSAVSFSYNDRDSLVGYADGVTSAVYSYDLLERKTRESVDYGQFEWSYSYGYLPNGQKQNYTAVDGRVFGFGYDPAKNLQSISVPGEGTVSYTDFLWTRPQRVTYPDSLVRRLGYDGLLRLETITATSSTGRTMMDYRYKYDVAGNIVEKSTEHGTYRFEYDALDRLLLADYPNGPQNDQIDASLRPNTFPFADDRYTYDPLGNRKTDTRQTGVKQWQYSKNNELLDSGFALYEYNASGSRVLKRDLPSRVPVQAYRYDGEEHLREIWGSNAMIVADYYYDPFGRRLWKTLHPGAEGHSGGGSAERQFYAYNDEGISAQSISVPISGQPPSGAQPELDRIFVFEPNADWSTGLVLSIKFVSGEAQHSYSLNDVIGMSVMAVRDDEVVSDDHAVQAFGQSTALSAIRFPGQFPSSEQDGLYNFHRYYDPAAGRYLTEDPLRFLSDINFFAYTKNNPIRFFDSDGQKRCGPSKGEGASTRNTIVCQGGELLPVANQCPPDDKCGVCNCTLQHEVFHVQQVESGNPCKGKTDGHVPAFRHGSELESPAYNYEIGCLQGEYDAKGCPVECKGPLCRRMNEIKCIIRERLWNICDNTRRYKLILTQCAKDGQRGFDSPGLSCGSK